jgi:hypothetical protein
MVNPKMSGIPGAGIMTDTLDFVKNLWGNIPGLNVPGMTVPTLSVEDLDKKISDLKAVESWLNVNMSMLRSTIQAMEVQRATIATLKAMSATLASSGKQEGAAAAKNPFEGNPFAAAFSFPPAGTPAAAPAAAPAFAPAPAAEAGKQPEAGAPIANASAWWDLLQQQFQHAVSSAMTSSDAVTKLGEVGTAMATDAASKLAAAIPKPMKAAKAAGKAVTADKDNLPKSKSPATKRSTPKG